MGDPRLLVLIGSGEAAPRLVSTLREVAERLGTAALPAVLLETPYGFQENAGEISRRLIDHFRRSVGIELETAGLLAADDALVTERALVKVRDARLVFAGPGSPTHALEQWRGTGVGRALLDKLLVGGAVVFASAAACTLGRFALPVYEIYKVGERPHWHAGLDVLAPLGLPAVVVPHFDNAEGGTHDTRYCYLGARRLVLLEEQLPDDVFLIGIDEHTAGIVDLAGGTLEVRGRGGVTVRRRGRTTSFPAGAVVDLDDVRSAASVGGPAPPTGPVADEGRVGGATMDEGRRLQHVFDAALAAHDVSAAVAAILSLEESVRGRPLSAEDGTGLDLVRDALRGMIVRLGDIASAGLHDHRDVIDPYVTALLRLREDARRDGRFEVADAIRDLLVATEVEVRDAPGGTQWHYRSQDQYS